MVQKGRGATHLVQWVIQWEFMNSASLRDSQRFIEPIWRYLGHGSRISVRMRQLHQNNISKYIKYIYIISKYPFSSFFHPFSQKKHWPFEVDFHGISATCQTCTFAHGIEELHPDVQAQLLQQKCLSWQSEGSMKDPRSIDHHRSIDPSSDLWTLEISRDFMRFHETSGAFLVWAPVSSVKLVGLYQFREARNASTDRNERRSTGGTLPSPKKGCLWSAMWNQCGSQFFYFDITGIHRWQKST